MSFWAGVASGFKDAKAAKAEKEELEARRAERQSTFEYNKGRDEKLDARYEKDQAESLRRWELNYKATVETLSLTESSETGSLKLIRLTLIVLLLLMSSGRTKNGL